MFRKVITSVVGASLALAPVAAHAAPAAAEASNPLASSMFQLAGAGLCMGAPAGCVLPLEKPAPPVVKPPVTPPQVTTPAVTVPEASGGGMGGILLGLLGAAAVAGIIILATDNEDDEPVSG